jgi:hypothetical protein
MPERYCGTEDRVSGGFIRRLQPVQLRVPLPVFVRFFQQQDASLTSRRWGCKSLTGHHPLLMVFSGGSPEQERRGLPSGENTRSWRNFGRRTTLRTWFLWVRIPPTAPSFTHPGIQRRHGEAAPHLFREQAQARCESGVSDGGQEVTPQGPPSNNRDRPVWRSKPMGRRPHKGICEFHASRPGSESRGEGGAAGLRLYLHPGSELGRVARLGNLCRKRMR